MSPNPLGWTHHLARKPMRTQDAKNDAGQFPGKTLSIFISQE
jgi:hypothetical protein